MQVVAGLVQQFICLANEYLLSLMILKSKNLFCSAKVLLVLAGEKH